MKPKYGLTIYCVDGDTIYGIVSRDKKLLLEFLTTQDHEGSVVSLKMERPDGSSKDIPEDDIYEELTREV